MTREEIYLAMHDHMVEVPHLGGSHVVYEFSPQELINAVQSLLALERDRCSVICNEVGDAWKNSYQAVRADTAYDIADLLRRLK
jgi:hypothetical protein